MDVSKQTNPAQVPVTVVSLTETSLNAANAPEVRDRLRQVIQGSASHCVLDLSQVAMIDSMGVSTLLAANRACRATGYQFALCGLQDQVKMIISLTKLDSVFSTFDSVPAATESFKPSEA